MAASLGICSSTWTNLERGALRPKGFAAYTLRDLASRLGIEVPEGATGGEDAPTEDDAAA